MVIRIPCLRCHSWRSLQWSWPSGAPIATQTYSNKLFNLQRFNHLDSHRIVFPPTWQKCWRSSKASTSKVRLVRQAGHRSDSLTLDSKPRVLNLSCWLAKSPETQSSPRWRWDGASHYGICIYNVVPYPSNRSDGVAGIRSVHPEEADTTDTPCTVPRTFWSFWCYWDVCL